MRAKQYLWTTDGTWQPRDPALANGRAQLVIVFAATSLLRDGNCVARARTLYPDARVVGCSTAGEICGPRVLEDSATATALDFDHSRVAAARVRLSDTGGDSAQAGRQLARALDKNGLVHVLVLSDGLGVNGSELAKGMAGELPPGVAITGGLSGDGAAFKETLVSLDQETAPGLIAAVGFYGERLRVGYGSAGGWQPFGPERQVTRAKGNVLYELDGRNALALYKTYLGAHAAALPASGLLFPLALKEATGATGVVRTLLGVNESDQSMTFAGDLPEGAAVRFMRAGSEALVEGAVGAARTARPGHDSPQPALGILVSCVGRKLVLKQRTEEEVEGVQNVFGPAAALTGFYSYGELCPFGPGKPCELHNQTMTVTTFSEN
jgi:hypothetical protein